MGAASALKGEASEEKFYFMIDVSGKTSDVGLVLLTEAEAELVTRVTNSKNWIVFKYGHYSGGVTIHLKHKYPEYVINELCEIYSLSVGEFKDCREFKDTLTYLENCMERESLTWEQALNEWKADNCD